jgi:hypothetical protein
MMLALSAELRAPDVTEGLYRELWDPGKLLSLGGPHCWYCAWRPVEAIVTLAAPGAGRGPAGNGLAGYGLVGRTVDGSKLGYWWKSLVALFSWCGSGSLRAGI